MTARPARYITASLSSEGRWIHLLSPSHVSLTRRIHQHSRHAVTRPPGADPVPVAPARCSRVCTVCMCTPCHAAAAAAARRRRAAGHVWRWSCRPCRLGRSARRVNKCGGAAAGQERRGADDGRRQLPALYIDTSAAATAVPLIRRRTTSLQQRHRQSKLQLQG